MKNFLRRITHVFLAMLAISICFNGAIATSAYADANNGNNNNQQSNANPNNAVTAKAAITMDAQTGQILYQKNANQLRAVASCTKILTLAVIEQDVAKGKLKWNQKVKINSQVAKTSTDWHFSNVELKKGHEYTIRSLAESMMIVSADGSAEALAFADAGSTQAFNKKMQAVAHKAGVTDAKIYNMIGLSNGELGANGVKGVSKKTENAFSAKDMALIARYLVNKYPDALNITKTATTDFKVDDKQSYNMHNINNMLPGAALAPKNGTMDGLKTGSTDKAGNCFVGTGTFNNRRLITVVLGTNKHDFSQQFKDTNSMLNVVQGTYQPVNVNKVSAFKGQSNQVRVAHGKKSHVKVGLKSGTAVWLPKNGNLKQLSSQLTLKKGQRTIGGHKLWAPVKKGATIGSVKVTPIKGISSVKVPVIAQQSVKRGSVFN